MEGEAEYPFVPKSNRRLRPGQFWAIPLSDGSFACGVVVHPRPVPSGPGSSQFVAGLLDWWGPRVPTAVGLGGASLLAACWAPISEIVDAGGGILGERPLPPDVPHPDLVSRFSFGAELRSIAQRRWVDPPRELPPERRRLRRPLTADQLHPARTPTGNVLISTPLDRGELALLDAWLAAHPGFGLIMDDAGRSEPITDLEMLDALPHLRNLTVRLRRCTTIDGLRFAGQLESLQQLGETVQRWDLAVLANLTNLRNLAIRGRHANPEAVAELEQLEDLTLRTTALRDLSVLSRLPGLRVLDLQYGRFASLDPVAGLPALEHLEVQRIKNLQDVDVIGDMPRLRRLMLAFLPKVTRLPDLSQAVGLRDVIFEHMSGLVDLSALATAPSLEHVEMIDPPAMGPEAVAGLASHPSLRGFSWYPYGARPSPMGPNYPKAPPLGRRPFGLTP